MGLFDSKRIRRLERQISYLQYQVAQLAAHVGLQPADPPLPPEFHAALSAGHKIHAIKIYREATGAGLAEAKKAVEEFTG